MDEQDQVQSISKMIDGFEYLYFAIASLYWCASIFLIFIFVKGNFDKKIIKNKFFYYRMVPLLVMYIGIAFDCMMFIPLLKWLY